jgi:hypothetical protein
MILQTRLTKRLLERRSPNRFLILPDHQPAESPLMARHKAASSTFIVKTVTSAVSTRRPVDQNENPEFSMPELLESYYRFNHHK